MLRDLAFLLGTAVDAVREICTDFLDRVDAKYAGALGGEDDET